MKNRRSSEKPDEYPQARQLLPPSSSGWYMDVLCTTTPLGVLNSRVIWESRRAYIRQDW